MTLCQQSSLPEKQRIRLSARPTRNSKQHQQVAKSRRQREYDIRRIGVVEVASVGFLLPAVQPGGRAFLCSALPGYFNLSGGRKW
jgi:hypothetical protein